MPICVFEVISSFYCINNATVFFLFVFLFDDFLAVNFQKHNSWIKG